jgi:hypothetical protein
VTRDEGRRRKQINNFQLIIGNCQSTIKNQQSTGASAEKHKKKARAEPLPRRALAFFLIVSPDQEENLNNPFVFFATLRFKCFYHPHAPAGKRATDDRQPTTDY